MQTDIREYSKQLSVEVPEMDFDGEKRWVITVDGNEAVEVDLLDVIHWVKNNRPEMIED